jgi:hypothetical protein
MTVASFPRTFPLGGFKAVTAELIRRQSAEVLASGRDIGVDFGQPSWSFEWTTNRLYGTDLGVWRAWLSSLRGLTRYFLGYDPLVEYPIAYMPAGWGSLSRYGGGSFDGTCTVTAIGNSGVSGATRDSISVSNLPVGLKINPGDNFGLVQSGKYSLHRVLDTAQITASGTGTLTMWVEPEVPAGFTTSATGNFYRASAKFRLVAKKGFEADASGRNRPGQGSFTGLSTNL